MTIKKAVSENIPGLARLLEQVLMVHHNGRPDLFKADTRKYNDSELADIIEDSDRPVFVAVDDDENVLGYAFCVLEQHLNDNILTDIKTLYIDDLCVDEAHRCDHIGTALYQYVLDYAKARGCYNVTLNVWNCNPGAMKFYEACGLTPYKIGMEKILTSL